MGTSPTYRQVQSQMDAILSNMQKYVQTWQRAHPHIKKDGTYDDFLTLPVDDIRDEISIFSACDTIVEHNHDEREHNVIRRYIQEAQRLGDVKALLGSVDSKLDLSVSEQHLLNHINDLENH